MVCSNYRAFASQNAVDLCANLMMDLTVRPFTVHRQGYAAESAADAIHVAPVISHTRGDLLFGVVRSPDESPRHLLAEGREVLQVVDLTSKRVYASTQNPLNQQALIDIQCYKAIC